MRVLSPDTPHIVKFSGGRSSGMLLDMMLADGRLDPRRGDCIIFNNTSAEHPATYAFVARFSSRARAAGIPFFWLEFCTVEAVFRGKLCRRPTYRLVHPHPFTPEAPNGYRHHGEVFEELLAWRGFLPNVMQRICTQFLKIETSKKFLQDWLAGQEEIPAAGNRTRKMTLEDFVRAHVKAGGTQSAESIRRIKQFFISASSHRVTQRFSDFSGVDCHPDRRRGSEPTIFVGFRADEPHRVARLKSGDQETLLFPLVEAGITKREVETYWKDRDDDLSFPPDAHLSNCVFCFLKGDAILRGIHDRLAECAHFKGTPADIDWWDQMEKKYARVGRKGTPFVFTKQGRPPLKARVMAAKASNQSDLFPLPCHCTD